MDSLKALQIIGAKRDFSTFTGNTGDNEDIIKVVLYFIFKSNILTAHLEDLQYDVYTVESSHHDWAGNPWMTSPLGVRLERVC